MSIGIPTGGAVTIGRSGSNFNITGGGIGDPTCGGATVNNVDTVEVAGAGGNESLTIDESGGPFAPGLTPEAAPAEIEFAVDLGAGTDPLTVQGSPAAEKITLGTIGANLNGDSDVDLTASGVESWTVNGGDGNDTDLRRRGRRHRESLHDVGDHRRRQWQRQADRR